jgi:transposase
MSKEDPRKLIIELLKIHPEGLTIASISKIIGLHRHTCTKYIHELIGAGAIIQRNVGVAKLCYLENKINDEEEKKLLEKLERRRSAEKYSLKLIASVVLITFLLSEVVIFAYGNNSLNETLTDNMSINTSPMTSSLSLNDSNISEMIENAIDNASNTTVEINDSLVPADYVFSEGSKFDIKFDYTQKITRGEEFNVKSYVNNIDSSKAKNVVLNWQLPNGFEIVSGNLVENCGDLEPNNACVSEIILKTDISTTLGISDIKIVVNYEK